MNESIVDKTGRTVINREKMQLTVTNQSPHYLKKFETEVKQDVEARLYLIFKKYV